MRSNEMAWDQVGSNGIKWDRIRWNEMEWDQMGLKRIEKDLMGSKEILYDQLRSNAIQRYSKFKSIQIKLLKGNLLGTEIMKLSLISIEAGKKAAHIETCCMIEFQTPY